MPAAAVRRVLAACPGLTVVDVYGPTETTTFATCHPMPGPAAVPDTVPIGRPLDNMQAYVLDRGPAAGPARHPPASCTSPGQGWPAATWASRA